MNDEIPLFLKYKRKEVSYRPIKNRTKDYLAVELPLTDIDLTTQSLRCMNCGTPFCHAWGCPLRNVIPEINRAVQRNFWDTAFSILQITNPFPEFTGRICPAPCESSCVLGIHEEPVAIRQIEMAVSDKSFEMGLCMPHPPLRRHEKKVAIIGSGPAGMAAAYKLNQLGFSVTVYEKAAKIGGILRYGIPDFKLEKWIIDRRVNIMVKEGIIFETCVEVGKDISEGYLHRHFDAILIAGGARKPRDLHVPGRNLRGIHFAMEYLSLQNMFIGGEKRLSDIIDARNKKVLVIGGGDTGSDCVGTAVRQGALSVCQIEILPKPPVSRALTTPWPEWPLKLRESSSHKEGCQRLWSITVKEFEGDDSGAVKKAKCCEVEWQNDGSFKEKPGSDFVIDADLVILAMGFSGAGDNPFVDILRIEKDSRGCIKRYENNMTSVKGIFVAGDMAHGASLVVKAIVDGLNAAQTIANYLSPSYLSK